MNELQFHTIKRMREFPDGPVVRTPHSHCPGAWVQSLAGELRSHKLHPQPKSFKN